MNKKLFINVNCWGENYIDGLIKYTIPCLLISLKNIDKKTSKMITFNICTDLDSIKVLKKNSYLQLINKIVNCEFTPINELLESLKKKTKNKYQFLSLVQNLMINYAKKKNFNFFMTLYPDFIFKKNTIKNLIKLIEKEDCDILVPIPQIIKEEVVKEIETKKIDFVIDKLEEINFNYLHQIILNNNINEISTNTPSLFCEIEKDYINFSNYHLHPILIKLNANRYKYIPFIRSLDEDFIKSIDYENKHYVIKNSNELLINSLLGIEELKLTKHKFNIEETVYWLNAMMYEINKKFSNSTYTILKKSNYKISKKNLEKMHTWINNINKRILPKKKANYADDYEYSHTRIFKNIQNFLFEMHLLDKKLNKNTFNNIIKKHKLENLSTFLNNFN